MRNLTKVLAMVLALSMIVGVIAFAKTYPDVDSSANYAEAVNVISDLGLAVGDENGNFNADKTLTRAEGTTFVLRLLGLEEAAKAAAGTATDFSDVPADHWASGYVSVAAANGIVSGMGDGTFAPNAELTYAQIVRMLVSALGYEPLVSELGEWPNNYMSAASQIKLTTGIPGRANDSVTRGTTARLIYAALTIPKMEKSGIGVNATWAAGDQMLLDDLGFFKLKGKVTDVDLAANKAIISIDKQCLAYVGSSNNSTGKYLETDDKDKWTIDSNGNITSKELNGFGPALKDSVNVPVIIYVADDDDYTIASFVEQSNVVETLAVDSADYKSNEGKKVTYYTNADQTKTSTFKLDDKVAVYLNGSSVGDADYDDFINDYLKAGDYAIELKDTDGDGYYDMAVVTDYKYMVVKTVKVTKDGVYTFTSETLGIASAQPKLIVDTDDDDTVVSVVKDGEEIDIADIEEGDILNIKGTTWSDKQLTEGTIYVTNEVIEGTVKSQDTEEETITLDDGNEYDYLTGVNTKYLEPSAEGSYYLNINGKIIYVDNSAVKSNYKYGFATLITLDARGGEINGGDVRVLTTDGTWSTIDLNATVNGTKLSSIEKPAADTTVASNKMFNVGKSLYVCAADSRSVDLVVNDMIAYKTNSSGAIRNIAVGKDAIEAMTEDATADINNKKYAEGDFSGYYVTDNTKIFSRKGDIPANKDIEENKISLISKNALKDDKEYTAVIYNINDDDEAGIIYGKIQASVDYEGKMFIVSKLSKTTVNDDDYTLLTGYQNGEEVSYKASDDKDVTELYNIELNKVGDEKNVREGASIEVDDLAKGDILFVTAGSDNVIATGVKFNNVLNPTGTKAQVSTAVTDGDNEGGFVIGYILGTRNTKVFLGTAADPNFDPEHPGTAYNCTVNDSTLITVYDDGSKKNPLDEGTVADLDEGAFMFARLNSNGKAMEVVIYTK